MAYLFVFYKTDMKQLDIPCLVSHSDRVTVLDVLYNHGTPLGHSLDNIRINMFPNQQLSIEESYLIKRVLRGFINLKSLVLWKVRLQTVTNRSVQIHQKISLG